MLDVCLCMGCDGVGGGLGQCLCLEGWGGVMSM